MSKSAHERKMILVAENEVLLLSLQRRFSPSDYDLVHAPTLDQALKMASIHTLRLVVFKASPRTAELARAMDEISAGRFATLGVVKKDAGNLDSAAFTRTAPAEDLKGLIETCRQMVEERRSQPRVAVRFPVLLDDETAGVVQNVSASGMLVNSMVPFPAGQDLMVQVGWGGAPLRFPAMVGRCSKAALGQHAMVLLVPMDETEARHLLKGLTDRVLDLHHYLASWNNSPEEDDARLDELADLYGLDEAAPGPLNISLSGPAPGPLLSEEGLKLVDDLAAAAAEEAEKEDLERQKQREEEERERRQEEEEERRRKEEAEQEERRRKEEAEQEERRRKQAEEEGEAEGEKEKESKGEGKAKGKGGGAIWALVIVIGAALATAILWPRISAWQQGQPVTVKAAVAPDMGPPPAPDASPEEIALSSESRTALMKQGRRLLTKKKYAQAIQALEQAMFLEDGEDVRRQLAKCHRHRGQLDEAIEHYQFLAERAPEVAWFPDMIGRLYQQKGQKEKACTAFRKAAEVDPTYKAAARHLRRHCKTASK